MDGPLDTAFRKDGFVLVPDVVPPAELPRLRAAAERLIENCRSGRHTTVRRSPRQDDMWGAGQLFQPNADIAELLLTIGLNGQQRSNVCLRAGFKLLRTDLELDIE